MKVHGDELATQPLTYILIILCFVVGCTLLLLTLDSLGIIAPIILSIMGVITFVVIKALGE